MPWDATGCHGMLFQVSYNEIEYDADICFTDSMKYWCGMVPPL